MRSQVGILGRGQDTVVTEDLLNFEQINARLNQMGCIAVAQAVRRNFFLNPKPRVTLPSVV